jgi:hypothetical protein
MKKSKKLMLVFWVTAILLDLAEFFYASDSSDLNPYAVASTFVLSFIMFAWFIADADDIRHKPSYGLKLAIVSLSFLAIPYYLIRYKGWGRALLSMTRFVLILFIYFAVMELLRRYLNL